MTARRNTKSKKREWKTLRIDELRRKAKRLGILNADELNRAQLYYYMGRQAGVKRRTRKSIRPQGRKIMAYKKLKNPRHKQPRKPWKAHTRAALLRKAKALKIKGASSMKKSQLIWHLSRKCKKPTSKVRRRVCRRRVVKRRKKLTVKQLISRIKKFGGKGYSGKRRASLVRMYGALKRKRR